MSFEIQQCPLCNKTLQLKSSYGIQVYKCSNNVELETGTDQKETRSHYEVELDSRMGVQHMYVGKYSVDNFANGNKSRIYVWSANDQGDFRWKFVVETLHIRPDTEEKLADRLGTLMVLL